MAMAAVGRFACPIAESNSPTNRAPAVDLSRRDPFRFFDERRQHARLVLFRSSQASASRTSIFCIGVILSVIECWVDSGTSRGGRLGDMARVALIVPY